LSVPRILIQWVFIAFILGLAIKPQAATSLYSQTRMIMGTFCEVQIYDSDEARAQKAIAAALDEMQRVDRLLSNYAPASELSAINREASKAPVRASQEMFDFIRLCRDFHTQLAGAFDPTVGPLVRAWGFFSSRPAKPSDAEIALAKSKSGFDKVVLNEREKTVFYKAAGLEIDPGGIGKGYAVDKAVAVLKKLKVRSALVSAGGSTLYGIGQPPGRDYWRIALRNPVDLEHPYAIARLKNSSLSTSGVAQQSVLVDGRRTSHIFDPRSGEPIAGVCQTSVVAPTATASDALTKATYILTKDEVARLFKKRKATHALVVEGECTNASPVWITPGSSAIFAPYETAPSNPK
jgi:thiamine biosynthesis lipoprotein